MIGAVRCDFVSEKNGKVIKFWLLCGAMSLFGSVWNRSSCSCCCDCCFDGSDGLDMMMVIGELMISGHYGSRSCDVWYILGWMWFRSCAGWFRYRGWLLCI